MKNRHLTIYVGDQEPRDKPAFLWIHRDPVTKYILFQINNGVDNWETITDSSMIAKNLQHTLDILSGYIEDAQEAIEAARALAEDATEHATPYIGDNGNWYIWNYNTRQYEDSGKPAKGDKGDKGNKGDTGDTGAVGPQGPVGPQGNTGSSVDYPFELVNNLTTDDATKGLSAAQGVVLKGEVSQLSQKVDGIDAAETTINYTASQTRAHLKYDGTIIAGSAVESVVRTYPAVEGGIYKIDGRVGTLANTCLAVFLNSDNVALAHFNDTTGTSTPYQNVEVIAPTGTVTLKVAGNTGGANPYNTKVVKITEPEVGIKSVLESVTISPDMEVGAISTAGNLIGRDNVSSFYGRKAWRSPRFFELVDTDAKVNASVITTGAVFRLYWYDESFDFLAISDFSTSGEINATPYAGAKYFRVAVYSASPITSGFDIPKPKVSVTSLNLREVYLNRPSSGSFSILVPVIVSNPDSDVNETPNLQDSQTILSDTGVLALPTTYTPKGEPTRLIIYCHGSGVNYATGTGTFPSTDIRPELWLAEGYAVMDVEGNPFDNSNAHGDIPAARWSYIAAYQYVLRKYNIKKDGVFLGGRSMGGCMVFNLLQSDIPVIAACPVAPSINTICSWEYSNSGRRNFMSLKMGFVGTPPTWTSWNPMTNEEWQYLQNNFDRFARYSPFFGGMTDTPSKADAFSIGNISSSASSTTEEDLYKTRHFKSKAPVKMFASKDDMTVNYARNCALVYQMMINAGQVVEMRYFPTGGHHFELDDDNLLASYTTRYGDVLTDVPVVYVEMLHFWQRFEQ